MERTECSFRSWLGEHCLPSISPLFMLFHKLAIEAGGKIKREQAIALGSTNLRKLLGGALQDHDWDLVATQGGDLLDFGSKIVATISAREGSVQTFS